MSLEDHPRLFLVDGYYEGRVTREKKNGLHEMPNHGYENSAGVIEAAKKIGQIVLPETVVEVKPVAVVAEQQQ